ncbi:hypothetical protein GQ57_30030 [Burkholderia sp. MSh2]|uniref:DUF7716 domain-containing protein n=1 Tax=Burkholderia paludis TaxID=1506587 RepID=A0A6J5EXB0_9BURK|nr:MULTISPECIES: hypothetical protein [Burkholderia]KEZ02310.1 hypothetical protein GQ57_30030 [Burkholderia sp. MSh2]KFG94999.1 hypothetical protein GQ56_0123540 [Burkholderia paludis]CAB3770813.1 hypothetical protein LMG30113_06316 [Burkholderia paludis]VWC39941.1 hypothetical protein BPA30113_06837 [Burkholderia paludis]
MSTTITTEASLKHILEHPGDFAGWLCLPPMPWTPDTEGKFTEDLKAADADEIAASTVTLQPGWRVTLSNTMIEEIVINAHDQVDEPSVAQLLDAFVFYVENDEFILF